MLSERKDTERDVMASKLASSEKGRQTWQQT